MDTAFKLVMFLAASAVIARVSGHSLRSVHAHGFYRFFAWEAALALALLNIDHGTDGPAYLRGIVYTFLGISAGLGVHGFLLLHRVGKPDDRRTDPALFRIEKTTILVTIGLYRYIRHPLYCSFFFLVWGVYLFFPSLAGSALALLATLSLIVAARVEEQENILYFGKAYIDYIGRTKMFIPFLI